MKLLFSEHVSDYEHYIFPYAVWAFPEEGETPGQLFDAGFLPSGGNLDRFYLCRQIRIDLGRFTLSSENRRILRKGEGVEVQLVPLDRFEYTPERRDFCLKYAEAKWGKAVMSATRLDNLFAGPLINHVLVFTDHDRGSDVGLALLYTEGDALAFYPFAFYDLAESRQSLGMFMMTSAVNLFAERGTRHIHLGTCYSNDAMYKTQFRGTEFFNGFRWSRDLNELKCLIKRDTKAATSHLLESEDYLASFGKAPLGQLASSGHFKVLLK